MDRDIEDRYYQIKLALRVLFDLQLVGREVVGNSQSWSFLCNNADGEAQSLYQVNAGTYIYDMSAAELASLLERIQDILDEYLLSGGSNDLWAFQYVTDEYQRGTLEAFNNLSVQSPVYAQQTTLAQLLSAPAYQNQVASALVATYSEWRGLADAARADLSNIITDAVARGVNPRETMRVISKRLNVSLGRARTIAQTEQVGALRQAQWNETDWASDRLGLRTALLWVSALKPTTRIWHAERSSRIYTTEQVREFYAEGGNRYNCYCAQIPCLVDAKGQIVNKGLVERLAKERNEWLKEAA